ncbi:MAG: hypothetical protein E7571_05210 [Ruminococcaceae bacterium]|nr:hypothetical protein [Oscillospiraceae bacterium]
MAKNRPLKIDKSFEELTEFFKGYINASVIDKPVDYLTKHTKYEYVLSAVIDYGDFKAKIIFSPTLHPLANFLDLKLIYPDSPYEFSIFDVFNLFDIQDFRQYYYEDITTKTELQQGLDELFEVIEKYHYDIKKAGEGDNLLRLTENFEADWNSVTDDDSEWKEDMKNDELFIDLVHPYFTHASDTNTKKMLSRMQKKNAKGKLDTLYEHRLLNYLESGNEFDTSETAQKNVDDRQYNRFNLALNLAVFAACVCTFLLIFLIRYITAFSGGNIIAEGETFGRIFVPYASLIIISLASGLLISIVIKAIFGRKLIAGFAPQDKKVLYKEKYELKFKGENKYHKIARAGACFFLSAFSLALVYVILITTGFADYGDSVKFSDGAKYVTVQKSDLEIYEVEGYYNDAEGKTDYESYDGDNEYYIVADNSEHNHYVFTSVPKGSEPYEFIESMRKDWGAEVQTVKAEEDIKGIGE